MNPDLNISWKIFLPATLAGRVELALIDPIHNKPLYGARAKLLSALLDNWLARESGKPEAERPPVPSLSELRSAGE